MNETNKMGTGKVIINKTNKTDTGKIVHGECTSAWVATAVTAILCLYLFYISTSPTLSHKVDIIYADMQSGKITSEYTLQFAQRYDIENKEYSRLEIYLGLADIALNDHFDNANDSSPVENSSPVSENSPQISELFNFMTKYSGAFQKMLLKNTGNEVISLFLAVISLLLGCVSLWLELNKGLKKEFNHTSIIHGN